MSRVKIKLPEQPVFETEIAIQISDINYGNHLGNDRVLAFMQETRLRYFRQLGYQDELHIEGIGTIQADAAIEYRGEAFYGDVLRCSLYIGDIGRRSIDFYYKLENQATDKLVARGKTGIAFYDYQLTTTVNVPPVLLAKIQDKD